MGIMLKVFAVISLVAAGFMIVVGIISGEGAGGIIGALFYIFSGILLFVMGDNYSRLKRIEKILEKIEKEKVEK